MTKNEIVSHNLQLVMDVLSVEEYQKFMIAFIKRQKIMPNVLAVTKFVYAEDITYLPRLWRYAS